MIRNRLSVLLAERGLKITKVANETNISRNTITAVSQNDIKMIQLETINELCNYLRITPCEFFEYSPLDIGYSYKTKYDIKNERNSFDIFIEMDVKEGTLHKGHYISCYLIDDFFDDSNLSVIKADIVLSLEHDEGTFGEQRFQTEVFDKLTIGFQKSVTENLAVISESAFKEYLKQNPVILESIENNSIKIAVTSWLETSYFTIKKKDYIK